MSEHDVLCPWPDPRPPASVCGVCIAVARARSDERERCSQQLAEVDSRVRAVANAACEATVEFALSEEREQIAQAIEAHGAHLRIADEPMILRSVAARIARNGGRDE